ncbi:hypothetical protein KQH62_04105 [bacterium]|nr:hypothetical protein [bacterium]
MKHRNLFLLSLTLGLLLSSCTAITSTGTNTPEPPIPSTTPTYLPTQTSAPTATATRFPHSDGPTLLIQTDFESYEIIDFDLDNTYPIELQGVNPSDRLGGMLSPSGSRLLLKSVQDQIQILDLPTGSIEKFDRTSSNAFQPEQAAEAALDALAGMKYSEEAALEAVKSAYGQSTQIIRWDQDDEHLFTVSGDSTAGTQLTSLDLNTGERTILEQEPVILEDFWVRGDQILLKKGYVFEPGFSQDDTYFVLNRTTGEMTPISLPADADRPTLGWYGADSLKLTHQTDPAGGIGFSILDLDSLVWETVVQGAFSSINTYQDGWLLFTQDAAERTTTIQRLNAEGDPQTETTLPEPCFLNSLLGETILLNCETESLKLDVALNTMTFNDPIFLLSGSPDGQTLILITRSDTIYRLASNLDIEETLTLEGVPLEIRWLPDSTSFLYRTKGHLYRYDLARDISQELLASDLLSDYTNLNAVWINLGNN